MKNNLALSKIKVREFGRHSYLSLIKTAKMN